MIFNMWLVKLKRVRLTISVMFPEAGILTRWAHFAEESSGVGGASCKPATERRAATNCEQYRTARSPYFLQMQAIV